MKIRPGHAHLALAAALVTVVGCTGEPPAQTKPKNQTLTLGELVYRTIHENLEAAEQCSGEYLAKLEPHHEELVTALDHMFTNGLEAGTSNIIGKALQPSVANGSLPLLTDRVGEALAILVNDKVDPDRETLDAMLSLAMAPNLFEADMVSSLAGALLSSSDLPARIHALRLLAEENDGVDQVLSDILSLATAAADDAPPFTCSGVSLDDVQGTVLRSEGFVEDPAYKLGNPAWMVRPDKHGNPRVLVDASTGKLGKPFVDRDGDGAADVTAAGDPVDGNGMVIDLSFLGKAGSRDSQGRALNEHGGLLYDTYDVKRSALSFSTQTALDFVAADLHHELPPLLDAVLGQPVTCSDGTTTCRYYPGTDHAVADLVHLGLEVLRYPDAAKLMDVLYTALTTDPGRAEEFLVAVGDVASAVDKSTLAITDAAYQDALIDLIPLLQSVFAVSNSDGQSTARLLVDLIAEMTPAEKAQISSSLGWMVEYQSLDSRPDPDASGVRVDYSEPRYSPFDNRSGLEQVLELVDYANCGSLFGHSVSYNIIDIAADLSPSTVESVIDLALAGLGITGGLGEVVVRGALVLIGCGYDRSEDIYDHLVAVDVLAKSGGLDWLLPIARVFQERGQIQVLLDIFALVARDLHRDEDGLSSTTSAIRRLEPVILDSVKAGALLKMFLALDLLHEIRVAGTGERASHLAIETLQYIVKQGPVNLRTGTDPQSSSLGVELLKVLKRVSARVGTTGPAYQSLSKIIGFGRQYLASTTSGGRRVLLHPNVRLLLATGLKAFGDLADVPPEARACYIDGLQRESERFLTGRHFATIVRLARHVTVSANAASVEDWVVSLLRGPARPEVDTYGPILQILASAASADVAEDNLARVLGWLKQVAADNKSQALRLVAAVDDMIARDKDGAMLKVLKNALAPGAVDSGASPAEVFAEVFADVSSIEPASACRATGGMNLDRLESAVSGMRDFLLDDQSGITTIWTLIGTSPEADTRP